MYCKVANAIEFDFLKKNTNEYILTKFKIREAEKKNPFYNKIEYNLPTLLFSDIRNCYLRRNYD